MHFYKNTYLYLALALLAMGGTFCVVFYVPFRSVPLVAAGASMLILGLVCLALSRSLPRISPETGTVLLEAGVENINALVEELGLRAKAIYLPSSKTGSGRPQALLPMSPTVDTGSIDQSLPKRLIVKFGSDDASVGLLIATPGSVSVELLKEEGALGPESIESSLTQLLVGILDVVKGVSVDRLGDEEFSVGISGCRLNHSNALMYQWIGTPVASIAASIIAEALDRPVTIAEEVEDRGNISIRLGVM